MHADNAPTVVHSLQEGVFPPRQTANSSARSTVTSSFRQPGQRPPFRSRSQRKRGTRLSVTVDNATSKPSRPRTTPQASGLRQLLTAPSRDRRQERRSDAADGFEGYPCVRLSRGRQCFHSPAHEARIPAIRVPSCSAALFGHYSSLRHRCARRIQYNSAAIFDMCLDAKSFDRTYAPMVMSGRGISRSPGAADPALSTSIS